ncbi:MAG: PhoU domain-containing protein [Candidatus Bathyarchaeia archaeon]|nr:AbrB/MazE/SpoVT family DNA-binding domain-containing protein [Candidatus Bathyarchaeota archaeon]
MELRKVQETADGTYFVTLPKHWAKRFNIHRGSLVYIHERENGAVMVTPYSVPEREVKAVVLEPSPIIERLIGENYLLGADVIEVRSPKVISSEIRDRVKRILKRFVGLEIVEEDSKKIVIQCLLEPSMLMPEKVLRRIHLISLEMEKDAVESLLSSDVELAETVVERDEEVDRLYFLIVRLVRAALSQPSLGEKLSITPIECLDYRLLASLLEHFADHAASIGAIAASNLRHGLHGEPRETLKRIGESIYSFYNEAFAAFLRRDLPLAESTAKECKGIKEDLARFEEHLLQLDKEAREKLTSAVIALNSMCGICVDIADLTRAR